MAEEMAVGVVAVRLLALAQGSQRSGIIHVTTTEVRARQIARTLQGLAPLEALVFPPWDCLPYDRTLPSLEIMGERMMTLHALTQRGEQSCIVITTPDALLQRIPPRSALRTFDLRAGAKLDQDELRSFCARAGYVLDERVDEVGEAAFRGEVIDIFPAGCRFPIRLELQGDCIGAIRPYDALSQRTQGEMASLILVPVSELPTGEGSKDTREDDQPLTNAIPKLETLFDHVPGALLSMEPALDQRCETVLSIISEAHRERLNSAESSAEPARPLPEPDRLYLGLEEYRKIAAERRAQLASTHGYKPVPSFAAAVRPGRAFAAFLQEQLAAGRRILLTGASEDILDRIRLRAERILDRSADSITGWQSALEAEKHSLLCLRVDLDRGFVDESSDVAVVAASDVLGSRATTSEHTHSLTGLLQTEWTEFHIGDLVVHADHGIGVLRGLEQVETAEGPREAVRLVYAKDAVLLVPTDELHKVWRYGSEESTVPLDRLDNDSWLTRRAEIEATLRKTARAMHAKAAKRSRIEAPKLIPPQSAYERFVARFPFTETYDQARAIEAVLNDLASGHPMDRLVVGDVGFGKTEVALRAAAASALAGKQVAVVAPTTVLARQHFSGFTRRFAGLGIEVAHLSRLVTRKEANAVKERLADGTVRVVVGTHALAGKGVEFADLGLLVIDEEHRFGAAHKRKLRTMVDGAHVLTLTATPIPRTLQSALVGLQELSIISTPPARRRPVRTFSVPFDLATIGAALRREKRRGGQSFVVVPRIEDIAPISEELRSIAPDLEIGIAHGKLPASEVDATMVAFSEGRGDVLLSTSIIESGLDVPSANTMIVLRADLFGLAELHQLRGRVGRGAIQAFCYLMADGDKELPETTSKRLSTLQSFDRLGAGMDIAARDLDLRGAGDLMGEEQAGHVKLIGVSLYQELLAEAMRRARGDRSRRWSTEFQIDAHAWIPEEYIPEPEIRLNIYHRAARATEPSDIDQLSDEIADRFGTPPPPVRALLELAAVRTLAHSLKVVKVAAGPQGVALTFEPGLDPREAFADRLAQANGDLEWKEERLVLRKSSEDSGERLALVLQLLFTLQGL